MEQSRAQRRLVKSPPELWAEVSSEPTLRRHLAEFGEIRITRVDPETTVAWEGERASGTVELAPAGWGTKVVLTATLATAEAAVAEEPEPEPDPAPAPEPVAVPEPAPAKPEPIAAEPEPIAAEPEPIAAEPEPIAAEPLGAAERAPRVRRRRRGLLARLFRRRPPAPAAEIPAPGPPVHDPSPPAPAPDPSPPGPGTDPVPPSPGPDPSPLPPAPDPVPPVPEPDPAPPPSIEEPAPPRAAALGPDRTVAILTGMLDDLGSAHRRIVLHD